MCAQTEVHPSQVTIATTSENLSGHLAIAMAWNISNVRWIWPLPLDNSCRLGMQV